MRPMMSSFDSTRIPRAVSLQAGAQRSARSSGPGGRARSCPLAGSRPSRSFHQFSARLFTKLRYQDFTTVTRDHTLLVPIADAPSLRDAARALLKRVPLDRRLRLMGIRAGSLVKVGEYLTPPAATSGVVEPGLFDHLGP